MPPLPSYALDIPSCLDANTGLFEGPAIHPTWTRTLALPKHGLHSERTGELYLGVIGNPANVYQRVGVSYTTPFINNPIVRLFTDSFINTEE
jgi:hypothetical protein